MEQLFVILREQFQLTVFELVVSILGVIVVFLVAQAVAAFKRSELYVQNERSVKLLEGFLLDNIVNIEARGADIDLTTYNQRADERAEQGLEYIDPRMLYLLDKADNYVSRISGFYISFDELLAKSERILQNYKDNQV